MCNQWFKNWRIMWSSMFGDMEINKIKLIPPLSPECPLSPSLLLPTRFRLSSTLTWADATGFELEPPCQPDPLQDTPPCGCLSCFTNSKAPTDPLCPENHSPVFPLPKSIFTNKKPVPQVSELRTAPETWRNYCEGPDVEGYFFHVLRLSGNNVKCICFKERQQSYPSLI